MMKKLFFAFLFVLAGLVIFGQNYSVTVSGTVEDINTGDPIPDQMVLINTDSVAGDFFYLNVVYTNDNGFFEDSFDVPVGTSSNLFVSTMGCEGLMLVEEVTFSENNNEFAFSFLACSDPSGGDDCQAMFYYYPEDNSMYTIQFLDESLGYPDSWDWDFGDGAASTEQHPVHTFDEIGEYLVSLTITSDSMDCTSTFEMPVYVGDSIWFPDSCMAMFFAYPDSSDYLTTYFIDMSISPEGDSPDSWYWDFGDGTTSEEQNPVHTYAEEGVYEVCLTINTEDGLCENTSCQFIEVFDWNNYCEAFFFYYPAEDSANTGGLSIQFIDSSFGNPSQWEWDFGDGSTAVGQYPVHTYENEGLYEVCLTISSADGTCEDTYCEYVEVFDYNEYCQAGFYYYPANDSFPSGGDYGIQFVDYSYGNPTSWDWDFGDGESSSEQNPLHVYAEDGIYEVCLTIANPVDSCESTLCQEVYVWNDTLFDCWAWFEYEIDDMTVDFEGYLMNSQEGDYSWSFGDGTGGTGQQISHTYGDDGIYEVTLTVTDSANDCTASYTEFIWVGDDIYFSLSGHIYLDDSLFADEGYVYLMSFDTIGEELISIAETMIEANGYYEFEEVGYENCFYFVQAELSENSTYYGDYVPTYHLSALHWMQAWPVFPFFDDYPADVYMIAADDINSTGDGLISGIVTNEDGRSVLQDIEILLLDENNNPISYMLTGTDGMFDFKQLPFGTYIIYTEIVGIETTPVTITLNADNPTANINIVVRNGEALLGIDDPQSAYIEAVDGIYPNPATGDVSIKINMKQGSDIHISVTNNYGQQVISKVKTLGTGIQQIKLDTDQLPKGLYFINVQANDGLVHVQKLIKL